MILHATIRGRVQGVCYRAWTRETAREMGLTGWVRNLPDGSVELQAQGKRDVLENLLRLCWEGPSAAKVEDIVSEWLEMEGGYSDFSIRH